MPFLIQTPNGRNKSMYFQDIDETDGEAWFTPNQDLAKSFPTKDEAKHVISINRLENCHVIPS